MYGWHYSNDIIQTFVFDAEEVIIQLILATICILMYGLEACSPNRSNTLS